MTILDPSPIATTPTVSNTRIHIGIIGAGQVAQTLARGWTKAGHSVVLGARNPAHEKYRVMRQQLGEFGDIVSIPDAARFGEILVLAINPWTELQTVLSSIEPSALYNKIIIDPSNAIDGPPPRLVFTESSLGERIQRWLPQSRIVKALNHLHVTNMTAPNFLEGIPATFVAGRDSQAKEVVSTLLRHLGWRDIFDLGELEQGGRMQEALMLTTLLSSQQAGETRASLALLRK
jgi:8-hydroxy-5-deazaflavin:NADPH oxidoreductase